MNVNRSVPAFQKERLVRGHGEGGRGGEGLSVMIQ